MRAVATFTAFCLFSILANGEGVVVSKLQQFHSNDSANAIKFDTVNPQGFVTWFKCKDATVRFEATQWFRYIEFPKPLVEATDPKILPIRIDQLKSLKDFASQFKKSAPFLNLQIASIESEVGNLEKGLVLHENKWIPREQYEILLKERSKAAERKAAEEEQKKQRELSRLKLESELQSQKTEERRAIKIQSLRDQIDILVNEKSKIEEQNRKLGQELLNIVDETIDLSK